MSWPWGVRATKVGTPLTLYCWAMPACSSTSTRTGTQPARALAVSGLEKTSLSISLQGPHQEALKASRTGLPAWAARAMPAS